MCLCGLFFRLLIVSYTICYSFLNMLFSEALSMPCFESTISPLTSSTEQSTTAALPATAASIVKCYPQPTKSHHSSAPLTSYQISAPQTNNMDYVNLDSLEIRPKSFLHDEM